MNFPFDCLTARARGAAARLEGATGFSQRTATPFLISSAQTAGCRRGGRATLAESIEPLGIFRQSRRGVALNFRAMAATEGWVATR